MADREPQLPKHPRPLSPLAIRPPKPVPRDKLSTPETHEVRCCEFNGRNLVVCIDGTANQFSIKNTNVVELFSRLVKEDSKQLAYYNSGIGTYAEPSFKSWSYIKQVIGHKLDMAIAWRFEKIVHAAYEWLSENYQPGDRIFLFGFSRGAYQVRVIAAMIDKVGLLHKGNKSQIAFAYELYAASDKTTQAAKESLDNDRENLCKRFKKTLSRPGVKVHFVGAWDTVSSVGVARTKSLPGTTAGMQHVCVFRHALALDERRVKFQPEYCNGGLGPAASNKGDVKEVWFAGSHSDIGGGSIRNADLNKFGPALRWMTYEAISRGLRMIPYDGQWERICPTASLTGFWRVLEYLPLKSLSYLDEEGTTRALHRGSPRTVLDGQLIHESVFGEEKEDLTECQDLQGSSKDPYRPKAYLCLPQCKDWDSLKRLVQSSQNKPPANSLVYHTAALPVDPPADPPANPSDNPPANPSDNLPTNTPASPLDVIERDPFASASHAISLLNKACSRFYSEHDEVYDPNANVEEFDAATSAVLLFITSNPRQGSLIEVPRAGKALLSALHWEYLRCRAHQPQWPSASIMGIVRALAIFEGTPYLERKFKTCKLREWTSWPEWITRVNGMLMPDYGPIVQKVLRNFGNGLLDEKDVKEPVTAIYPGASSLRVTTPQGLAAFKWGESEIKQSTSRLPEPAATSIGRTLFVSLNYSGTMQLLNPGTEVQDVSIEVPGASHSMVVRISHTQSLLVSGSRDGSIWVWDVKKQTAYRLGVHDDWVRAVAFSADDAYVVSASDDETARIWNIGKKKAMTTFRGHERWVLTVAWSPSQEYVGSGDAGGFIFVWDITGHTKYSILAHYGWVRDLVFSSYGDLLASGGDDGRVIVWYYQTWQRLWNFETEGCVSTVAFNVVTEDRLPTRLISGDEDGLVRIWDVEINPYAIRDSSQPVVTTTSSSDDA